jgi:O-methyltransferase involved in polyketide biosynthesis
MYLDREAVEATLRRIAGTAAGSVVAFDYFSAEIIESRSLFMRYARAVVRLTGEPEEQRNFGPETDRKRAMAGFAAAIVSSAGYR